jgi:integrase
MEEVSKWLGHTNIAITQRSYAFLEVEHLHKAVKRAEAANEAK